jgi:hypothetical protein
MFVPTVLLLLLMATAATSVLASPQPRFLVIANHTKEECVNALDEVKATGTKLLEKCDWGCMAGDHTCYIILEAKDEISLKKMLPGSWNSARITPLNKFTASQIASFHKK